jgi:zinc protease
MRTRLFTTAALAALALAGCQTGPEIGGEAPTLSEQQLPEGVTLVERVQRQGDEVVIPYSKYVLDNGLTVVLHEDDSDPLVHVDVTYHVGSGREEPGKSGFAHFFEHMMFQGSQNVGDEEHFRIVSEAGGTLNGTTNSDRTNYYQTVPRDQLEKVLYLEADRMGFLLPAVTQEKFEVQRETVKNERGQRYDNAPYGLLFERVGEAMYPEGHPYSWSTIGYIEDLNRADLDDLKRFFLRWYGPNNAVLTIGGDIEPAETLEAVVKYFGSIPRGPEVEEPDPAAYPVELDQDRYISMEDNVALPLLYMSFPTVHARHPDEPALDVLSSIMGDGRTSLLYKNLVKDGFAVQAQTSHGCRELHCAFTLLALPNPQSGKTLRDMEETIRASFEEFEERGVLDDDLERVKAGIVSDLIFGLESVSGKVSQLAFFETFTGSPDYIQEEIERYRSVTKEDVMRVYEEYVLDQPAVIMSIVPDGQPDAIAQADTWQRYERTIPKDAPGETTLALREPADGFDRSVLPGPSGEPPVVTVPDLYEAQLPNGVEVLGAVQDETPTTAIAIRIEAGQRDEPLGKLGLASLTAAMLNEATQRSTNEDLSNRLAKLGSTVSVSAGDRFTEITIRSLTENLGETLAIARERLLEPAFTQEDFARVKAQTIEGINFNKKEPSFVASTVFNSLLFGSENAFSYPDEGTIETVQDITLDDVRAFYEARYAAGAGSVVAVSDLSEAELTAALGEAIGDWSGEAPGRAPLAEFPALSTEALYLVDKPGAAQSEIRIGKRAMPFDATGEFYRANLANFILGGAFNSRINLNLREDKGYTYGARSFFNGTDDYGYFRAQAGVRTDVTAPSIEEFVSEIDGYGQGGITAGELAFTQEAIGRSEAREYETPRQKLGFLSQIQTYDLPRDFVERQQAILEGLTPGEVAEIADDHFATEDMIMVVVGDAASIRPSLEALGRRIVELDEDGLPKGVVGAD